MDEQGAGPVIAIITGGGVLEMKENNIYFKSGHDINLDTCILSYIVI